jgi:3-phosphoshikimate 1-carboxyvinyltransferase
MGIEAACTENALLVRGGKPKGSIIDTYNDHRIAMSFAIAGLNVPGVCIRNEGCVEKSFPAFWQVFEGLYQS